MMFKKKYFSKIVKHSDYSSKYNLKESPVVTNENYMVINFKIDKFIDLHTFDLLSG